MSESVRVFIRPRPLNSSEIRSRNFRVSGNTITCGVDGSAGQPPPTFTFDRVASENASQEEVWDALGRDACERFLNGFNGSVFCYGQTGTGKTHTMMGNPTKKGILPRAIDHIFARLAHIRATSPSSDAVVRVSYLELYNEILRDLLRPGPGSGGAGSGATQCVLREDSKRGVWVEGCLDEPCPTAQHAHTLLLQGTAERKVAATLANEQSSRSHAIFTLTLRRTERGGVGGNVREVVESKIHFVDLAGSERQKSTATQGIRLKEASSINKSLHALSRVLDSLVARTKAAAAAGGSSAGGPGPGYTNFRDSKLTFLLKDALGGNCVTWVVACVTAAQTAMGETLSTLRFANNAKQIRNPATRNVEIEATSHQALQSEVLRLRAEVSELRSSLSASAAPTAPSTPVRTPSRPVNPPDSIPGDSTPVEAGPDGREVVLRLLERLDDTKAKCDEVVKAQKEHTARLERALQQQKMALKLKEKDTNSRNTVPFSPTDSPCPKPRGAISPPEDVSALRREIDRLTHHHPDVTRFAAENIELRGRLARMEQPSAVDDTAFTQYLRQVLEENGRLRSPEFVQRLESELEEERARAQELSEALARANEACTEMKAENEEVRELFVALERQNEELRTQFNKQGTAQAAVVAELAEARARCLSVASRAAQLEGELGRRRRESQVLDIEKQIGLLMARCDAERQNTVRAETRCSELVAEVERVERELEETKTQLRLLEGIEESYNVLKDDHTQLTITLNDNRAHAARLEACLQAYRDSATEHDAEEVAKAREIAKDLTKKVSELESDLGAKCDELNTAMALNSGLSQQIEALRMIEEEAQKLKEQLNDLTIEKNGLAFDNDQLLFENELRLADFEKAKAQFAALEDEVQTLKTKAPTFIQPINPSSSISEFNEDAAMIDSELDGNESGEDATLSQKAFHKSVGGKENADPAINAEEELMNLRMEYRKLADEHARVLRSNKKQKIRYMERLKTENNSLREEIKKLQRDHAFAVHDVLQGRQTKTPRSGLR
ncbi:kinesin-domain-containing protein [Gonapodya prolifera JEL478]|uniref:Kinesin-domain-containing protein n=1 Tax=Gonapodya prolifera (strain JEL478) TaxID=1344416 RepID=A0A139A5D1_GONPJ|nr:kinesin-domain-containing protein [Gonapodya prolifera JEL478]|eukprot:KXS11941.1 kinesin-domain-containing protein [Gonapodya prolifera JEL478]